jgi:hypothetical protein
MRRLSDFDVSQTKDVTIDKTNKELQATLKFKKRFMNLEL